MSDLLVAKHPFSYHKLINKNKKQKIIVSMNAQCVCCDKKAEIVAEYKKEDGSSYYLFCANDLTPMTLDHIIPVSSGGIDRKDNYQVLCKICNKAKGSQNYLEFLGLSELRSCDNPEGKELWKKAGKKYHSLGIIEEVCKNPITQRLSVRLGQSFHYVKCKKLFVKEVDGH